MARACPICTHERRGDVESALQNNVPLPEIARRVGTSVVAILNHRGHLAGIIPEAPGETAKAEPIVDRIKHLQERCLVLLDVADGASEVRTIFTSLRQMRVHIEALGELAYELGRPRK